MTDYSYREDFGHQTDWSHYDRPMRDHDFLPVLDHPDDDECTYRADGTDLTYCGHPKHEHE